MCRRREAALNYGKKSPEKWLLFCLHIKWKSLPQIVYVMALTSGSLHSQRNGIACGSEELWIRGCGCFPPISQRHWDIAPPC